MEFKLEAFMQDNEQYKEFLTKEAALLASDESKALGEIRDVISNAYINKDDKLNLIEDIANKF